jgi:hypothetical protein
MAYRDDEISGIGGWLLLFVLTLGVFTPFTIIYLLFATFSNGFAYDQMSAMPGLPAYRAGVAILRVASLSTCLFLTWRLCKVRTWQTIRLTIMLIWIMGLGVAVGELLLIALLIGDPFAGVSIREFVPLARVAAYATIWTAYLLRSRRVANTYPRHGDEDRLAAIFD